MTDTDRLRRRLAALAHVPTRTRRGDPRRRQKQALIAEVRTLQHSLRITAPRRPDQDL